MMHGQKNIKVGESFETRCIILTAC